MTSTSRVQVDALLSPQPIAIESVQLESPCCGDIIEVERVWDRVSRTWGEPVALFCDNCDQHWDLQGDPL